jgi:hypothetical protein
MLFLMRDSALVDPPGCVKHRASWVEMPSGSC